MQVDCDFHLGPGYPFGLSPHSVWLLYLNPGCNLCFYKVAGFTLLFCLEGFLGDFR